MSASIPAAAALLLKRRGSEIESEVRGPSMHPALPAGTKIRVQCGDTSCQRGDIIVLMADTPIVHRVVARVSGRRGAWVITRGDAVWYCDLPVRPDRVLGVVRACDAGTGWQAPGPAVLPHGPVAVLRRLSYWTVRAALAIDERLASLAVRAGGAIGKRIGRVAR